MNNELKKTIDSLTRNKEKNIKTIEKYENSIKDLKKENKQIDNEINKLKVIAKKYESLDEQVRKVLDGDEDILYELGRIGNNLNQITRGLNTNIIKGEEFELKDLKRNIDTIRNDLKILQETVNQYYKDNNIKKLEQIKIEE